MSNIYVCVDFDGTRATIKDLPEVGSCEVIRAKRFASGVKYQLKDRQGRTWHKLETEIIRSK